MSFWFDNTWEGRVGAFLASPDSAGRFAWPFPMGVFGTLRMHQCNNSLMQAAGIERWSKGFLPNFVAEGLRIVSHQGGAAPFEVFEYNPEDWAAVIPAVDQLESFDPARPERATYYRRTLAWVSLLPDEWLGNAEISKWFRPGTRADLLDRRDIAVLTPGAVAECERIPCWIYSSEADNARSVQFDNNPIIWSFKGGAS